MRPILRHRVIKLGLLFLGFRIARAELSVAFRLADFHDAVLGSGGVPLGVLAGRIQDYIDETGGI